MRAEYSPPSLKIFDCNPQRNRTSSGRPFPALRAGAADHHAERPCHDFDIEPQTPVVDIRGVERDVLIERRVLTRLNLPQTGDAGQYFQTTQMRQLILADLSGQRRSRANHAHVPGQYVKELRQLVERILP